jgi:hypothetical protein
MITRRCTQRQFLMRPDRETTNAFLYCLAVAAQRYRIRVLFTLAMSNHHHTGIEDPEGNYPAFLEHFHKLFAKCQNALRGRWENFWSSEQTSVVRLVEPSDILDKMAYALANPVQGGLVEKAHHWPGASTLPALLHDKPLVASRPRHFFRDDGGMPEVVTLDISRPTAYRDLCHRDFAALERRRSGTRIMGRQAVLAQDWRDRPDTREPRRQLDPRVAARSKWSRIEALLRNRDFRDAYVAAREAFIAGVRDVVFPAGTYWLRRFVQAICAPVPDPA